MLKKHWFKLLVSLSILFVAAKLVSADQFNFPAVASKNLLAFSLFLLLISFFLLSERWKRILSIMGMEVSRREAAVSVGLPIFSKYVPGKVFMILGKTGYLNRSRGFQVKTLSLAALIDQLLAISVGLAFGAFFLFQFDSYIYGLLPGVLLISSVLLLLFHPTLFEKSASWLGKKLGKSFHLKKPPSGDIAKLLPWHVLYWASLGTGFYFLASSMDGNINSPLLGLAFPFSVCAGIAALFAPGGIGVRESVLLGAMAVSGTNSENALQIALASRLWFMAGELFIFLLALALSRKRKGGESGL